jgi:hypothetical protein
MSKIISILAGLLLAAAAAAEDGPKRPFRAQHVFDYRQSIVFQDDFRSGRFGRWNFSEDDRYGLLQETPDRMRIVNAPGLKPGPSVCEIRRHITISRAVL